MRSLKFTKMQGAGNDYIYINGFEEKIDNPSQLAIDLSNRNFGIGSDGLVIILPSSVADFRMQMFNSDGSEAEMCGNASRCVAKWVYDNKLTTKKEINLETKAGIKHLTILDGNEKSHLIKVDMGEPILTPVLIPALVDKSFIVNYPIEVGQQIWNITGVSMGNPHAVVFVEDTEILNLQEIGPLFETHKIFPRKTNTEFIKVIDRNTLKMRVWERGAGETLACGTGACAAVVASILNDLCERTVTVNLRGGNLSIEWNKKNNHVYMTGPAVTVFSGELLIN